MCVRVHLCGANWPLLCVCVCGAKQQLIALGGSRVDPSLAWYAANNAAICDFRASVNGRRLLLP
uniref:Uncharacterized protein n=1 Tax=Anopheles albimanus TaxID=7167 RepID=A0A182FZC6_ANOAL